MLWYVQFGGSSQDGREIPEIQNDSDCLALVDFQKLKILRVLKIFSYHAPLGNNNIYENDTSKYKV